mmetsp:Transcript_16791/g.22526  ORF Transcript_16791/g.22526 Transcript_16791/m.22526 type:complete len:115 (+) Transcript_16791:39-383(+)
MHYTLSLNRTKRKKRLLLSTSLRLSPPIELTIRRNTSSQSIPLQPQTILHSLILIALRESALPLRVRHHAHIKGLLAVDGTDSFANRNDGVLKGVNFVVVQNDAPHFFWLFVFF